MRKVIGTRLLPTASIIRRLKDQVKVAVFKSTILIEVFLVFRPFCSLVKVDHGFISGC